MKIHIQFTTALIIALSALIVGAFLAILLDRYSVYSGREFMPPLPVVDGISFTRMELASTSHSKARHFRFAAKQPSDSKGIAELFEPQLRAEGWEQLATATTHSEHLSVSTWRHETRMRGGLYLVFFLLQLESGGEYFGTMETIPYWSYSRPSEDK